MSAFVPIPGYATTMRTLQAGTGAQVSKGDKVTVHAKGTVVESGKVFWSTKSPGQKPFTYDAGVGGVITGWDQGCLGMAIGEIRELNIPAHEGYVRARGVVVVLFAFRNRPRASSRRPVIVRSSLTSSFACCVAHTQGAGGFPAWGIPPGGTLLFEIEVLAIAGK